MPGPNLTVLLLGLAALGGLAVGAMSCISGRGKLMTSCHNVKFYNDGIIDNTAVLHVMERMTDEASLSTHCLANCL